MRKANELFRPQKSIKIPLEFIKKMDKISMNQLRETELMSKRESITKIALSPVRKSAIAISIDTTRQRSTYNSLNNKPKSESSLQKAPRVRFRSTGAGFRQRRHEVIQQNPPRHSIVLQKTSSRVKKRQQPAPSTINYEEFLHQKPIVKREVDSSHKRKEINPLPQRIFFGQKFQFKQQGQFDYQQKFAEEDFQWEQQSQNYHKIGFGVDTNLSYFDIESLSDPLGQRFLQSFKEKQVFCPMFKNNRYEWIKVKVLDFEPKTHQAIVYRPIFNDKKKASTLSIRASLKPSFDRDYWLRISSAKRLRKFCKEQQKYIRYIASRKEYFNMMEIIGLKFNQRFHQMIERNCFNPYYRQFIIYKEMALKPQKFQSMGLKIRTYTPFKQTAVFPQFQEYNRNKQQVGNKHYSRFPKFPNTLYKLYERINEQSCNAIQSSIKIMKLQDLNNLQCNFVSQTCKNMATRIRQFLLSDILGQLAFAFKSKQEEKKYIKLHNFIFKDLIIQNLYEGNVHKWVKLLGSFLTWTIYTPKPIIKLYLSVDKPSKTIEIQPNAEKVKESLIEPLKVLQKLVSNIPDILSQLLGGEPTTIKIKNSLIKESKSLIEKVVLYSFDEINKYCHRFTTKLMYLQKFTYEKQPFTPQGRNSYEKYLQSLRKDMSEVNHSVIFNSGIFDVDPSNLKDSIKDSISKYRNRMGKLIQKQVQEEVQYMSGRFKQQEEKIKEIPKDQEELVKMREYLNNDCQIFLQQANQHYQYCLSFYKLLQDHFIDLNFAQYQKTTQSVIKQYAFMQLINSKFTELNQIQQQMIQAINNQRDTILKGLEDMGPQIAIISNYSSLSQLSENYISTSKTFHQLQNFQKQLANINYRESVLSQQISIFPVISKLQRQLRPYFDVWNNAYTLVNMVQNMKTDPISNLKYDDLKTQITQFAKELQRLSSYFTTIKNPSALWVIQSLTQKVDFVQDKLWIIRSFTLEGVLKKQGIRKEILTEIFGQKQIKFGQMTLQTLLHGNVQKCKDFVIKNAEKAQRIWKLQLKIAGIVNQVKKLQFQFSKQLQVPFVQQKLLLSLSCAVHEQLSVMQAIKDLEQASYIQKKVNSIYSKLVNIEQTLLSMISFQQVFFPQLKLLKIQEISREMGKQISTFADVERIWKSMCHHFMKDNQVWQAIQTDSYKNRLENLTKMMAQIDKKINQVIDNKRQIFPRLFFLSPQKMRTLLLNQHLITSSSYLPWLFSGIKDFLIKDDKIKGIIGWDNQQVPFKKNASKTIVWQYLKFVQEEIGRIIQWELNFKSNKTQKYIFSKSIKIICEWTYHIQQAISSRDFKTSIQKLQKQLSMNQSTKKYQSYIYSSFYIMIRDTVSTLQRKNVYELSNFQWKKTVKYYMTEGGGIQTKILNFGIPFKQQYTGNFIRPWACLSDQTAVQIINLSWHMNTGLMIQRKSTQTIKEIAGLTLRHYVQFEIGRSTQPQETLYMLRGYLCSDIWMTITQKYKISKSIFEIIAQSAFQVHSAIQSGRSLCYIGGQHLNLPKPFKFNLFIGLHLQEGNNVVKFSSFENNKLQSINTKFGVVFRSVNWILPSESMICRFKLESLGVLQRQMYHIMKVYELLLLQINQQWFCLTFSKLLDQLMHQMIDYKTSSYEILINLLKRNLPAQQIQHLMGLVNDLKKQNQGQSLQQIIQKIQQNKVNPKRRVLLVGEHLSGKDFHLKEIFKKKGKEIIEKLQYIQQQNDNWLYISIDFYSKIIPLQQKLIVKASKMSFLDQSEVISFIVYYHQNSVDWKKIAQNQSKKSSNYQQIKEQAIRQLTILFTQQLKFTDKTHSSITKNAFTLSFFKLISIFCRQYKIQNTNMIQKVQIVFMILFWQCILFFPMHALKPSDFGSTFEKEPLNYYYDLQKSAWLEWTTLPMSYFANNVDSVTDIFLPTKQTVSFIYFFSILTSKSNIWVQAQSSGIGLHKIIKKTIKKGLLQFYKAHKDANCEGISSLVSHNIAIFKKQGKYYPKLNQSLIICIEDVNLPRNLQFNSFMSVLLNYSYEKDKKRLLANSTFICTNSNKDYNKDVYITCAKNLVRMKALSPSNQSIQTIFNYYLEWFFGNTENPFSKQVRNASEMIVQLSRFIIEQSNSSYSNIIKCSHIIKVFEGLCQCSPKTVKTTLDIFQLWLYECKSAFHNQNFFFGGKNILDICVKKFLSTQQFLIGSVQMNIFKEAYRNSEQIFLKMPSLKIEYSETYRKVDRRVLHQHITQLIQKIDHKVFSHFPLIIFESLLDQIIRIIRVLNIPNRNILIYGGKGSGKTTLARIASFICCDCDSDVISSVSGWKQNLGKTLHGIRMKNRLQCLVFRLRNEEQEQFMTTIQELLYLNHPQSLLFDKTADFLQNIRISSTTSDQYKSFQNTLFKHLHCCITLPSHDPSEISNKYPYLFRRVQLLNIHTSYVNNGPIQIAKASIGKHFQNYNMLAEINKILIQAGIQMNQGKFMRLSQIALSNYEKCIQFATKQQERISKSIQKIRKTEHQKQELQRELEKTNKILDKLSIKVQQLRKDYKEFEDQYQDKVKDFNEHNEQCQIQREKTNVIRKQVDFQLSKVLPMLKSAQQAMAKVTRDDINQLRSFPSPPLPAAKVVQSLIFLFNQSHLVKEKVLDGGQKVRDFWQYAKKMILNDKLLKRVSQYKPDTIKDLDKTVIHTLKQIIKKPEFVEERVFKASVAAGNLSLWIKAILAVYDVMTVIQPKKKLLNEAQQALSIREFHLKNELQELNAFHSTLMDKKKHYQQKLQEKEKVIDKIHELQHFIANGKEILEHLYIRQKEWKYKSQVKLKELLQLCKQQSIYAAVYFSFICVLEDDQKSKIIKKIEALCSSKNHFRLKKYQFICFAQYQQNFLKTIEQLKGNNFIVPFTSSFYESLIWIHELISIQQKTIIISDKTFLLQSYISQGKVSSLYEYHPHIVDCLSIKRLQDLLEMDITISKKVRQDDQQDFAQERTARQVLILINIQHRPQFLLRIRQILIKYHQLQIIIIANEESTQFKEMMKRQRMKLNSKIENSLQIKSYILKEIFDLPIQETQELNRNIIQRRMTNRLIDLFCQTDNIILSEDQFDQWISLHKEETDFHTTKPQIKKIGRVQQQKIQQILHIFDERKTINIPKMIEMTKEHLNQGEESTQKSLWTLSEWLKTKLSKWPQSLIKIIATNYENFNALAYYLLKFNSKMVELQNNKPKDPKQKDPRQSPQNKIASLDCQVIDPFSLVHSLRRNEDAYLCLTDKYRLKRALEQCKEIQERYKTQYLQEFLQREQLHYIYLISECGTFHTEEIVELKDKQFQEVITHTHFQHQTMNFKEAYQIERTHRRFESLVPKEKQYIRQKMFNRPLVKLLQSKDLYYLLRKMKEELKKQGKVIIGVVPSVKGKIVYGGQTYNLSTSKQGKKLSLWEIQESIIKLHQNT